MGNRATRGCVVPTLAYVYCVSIFCLALFAPQVLAWGYSVVLLPLFLYLVFGAVRFAQGFLLHFWTRRKSRALIVGSFVFLVLIMLLYFWVLPNVAPLHGRPLLVIAVCFIIGLLERRWSRPQMIRLRPNRNPPRSGGRQPVDELP